MKLENKIIPAGYLGPTSYYVLRGKPTDNPNVSVYLLNVCDTDNTEQKSDYSLWNVEILDDKTARMSPYKGEDYEALKIILGEEFLEHALDDY